MNKSDIVSRVAAQASLSRAAADSVVNAVFTAIGDGLARHEAVAIAGFGTFSIKLRPARSGRNPRTAERITIRSAPANGPRVGSAGGTADSRRLGIDRAAEPGCRGDDPGAIREKYFE